MSPVEKRLLIDGQPYYVSESVFQGFKLLGSEVDRLRALIKANAPHDDDCHLYLTWYERERRCTCWKAEAL